MEYGIRELAKLAGISTRTLRYYDEIALLKPLYVNHAGYRYYGEKEVALLQQILFYRERGFELKRIQEIIYQDSFDLMSALEGHLMELEEKRSYMDSLIHTVKQTISAMKGEYTMTEEEKFKAFKKNIVKENEGKYGTEIREKYGEELVNRSNQRLLKMSQEDYQRFEYLEKQIKEQLKKGVSDRITPESQEAREIVKLHKEWLCMTWKKYSPQAHKSLAAMYLMDERFLAYYDQEMDGCAVLLEQAVQVWAEDS